VKEDYCTDIFFIGETENLDIKINHEISEYHWFDYSFQRSNMSMHKKFLDRSIWEKLLEDGYISDGLI
jgi:hypothetical protein